MKTLIKDLWPAVALILAASLILLLSDLGQRSGRVTAAPSYPTLAILQIASTPLLDNHVAGIINRLEAERMVAPDRRNLRLFNAQGDLATANTIAREIVNSPADIVITSSTLALQTFAKANLTARKTHVFGGVTDPYGAGVGISGKAPDQHPPYMAGIGTFQPVRRAFELLHEMNPAIRRVGVAWNPGEQCSEACLNEARPICDKLGIALIEATVGNTSEVSEAGRSLIARGVEAIWIGGDTTATAAAGLLISLAKQAGIPVFTNDPSDAEAGALFGLGADYFTVGQYTADVAVAILRGKSPANFAIENVIPEKLRINRELLAALDGKYRVTPAIEKRLAAGAAPAATAPPSGSTRSYTVRLIYFAPAPIFETTIAGFKDKMRSLGFVEGRNLTLTTQHANTDMSMLSQVTAAAAAQKPDLLIPLSTPALSSAIAHAKDARIVFGIVSAPLEAGAGKSFEDHLPNVTGIHFALPSSETFAWALALFPGTRRIGVLYNPSEANSVKELDQLGKILGPRSISVEAVAVASTSEVAENIHALLAKAVDLVFVMGDNTVANGLPAIIKACRQKQIPVIADDSSLMGSGALLSCGPGPYLSGQAVAELAARVLRGESPADIPIAPAPRNELALDPAALKALGIQPPPELLARADLFFNVAQWRGRPARVALVNLVENAVMDAAQDGLETGLRQSGLVSGTDYILKKFSAQGEMGQLPQIIDAALGERPDAILTLTTPALMAAVQKVGKIPLIFSVTSDPFKIGIFKDGRPENVCGIHDDPPVAEVLEMARRHDPSLTAVGIVYDPSQINALISVDKLRTAGKQQQVQILEAAASAATDLDGATRSVIQRGARAIILSADNLANTGFAVIHRAARAAGVPIYVTDLNLVEKGATGGVGDDYFSWGRQSGFLAAKVLAGAAPRSLPIQTTQDPRHIEPRTPPSE